MMLTYRTECIADEQTSNGNVTVLNSERLNNSTGPLKTIHGYAVPTAEAGKFVVHLETVPIGAPCKCFFLKKFPNIMHF